MPVYIDTREKGPGGELLKAAADDVWNLDVPTPDGTEPTQFFDILVVAQDDASTGSHRATREFKLERKDWPDFVKSWREGKLEDQLAVVDGLIIECNWATVCDDAPLDPAENQAYFELQFNAFKHLATLSANMWVMMTPGPHATMKVLRYLERNPQLKVRQNRVKGRGKWSTRRAILAMLPRFNPDRVLPNGSTAGEEAEKLVDWSLIELAIDPVGLHKAGIIPLASAAQIAKALRED